MSFNIDDPLAGILSDGSDDSFFDDDILGKKKTPKKKSTPTFEKKSTLFDLDIDDNKPKSVSNVLEAKRDSIPDLGKTDKALDDFKSIKPVSPAPFKRTLSKESVKLQQAPTKVTKSPAKPKISASTDSLDILGDLNIDSRKDSKSIEKGKSSQSLLDDILGGTSTKTGSSTSRPTAVKSQEFDFDSILGKSESKATISVKDVPQKSTTTKVDKPKEEKVSKKTKTTEDWLGIFEDKEESEDVSDMPAWLGGGDSKKKKKVEPEAKPEAKKEVREEKVTIEEEKVTPNEVVIDPIEKLTPMLNAGVMKSSNEDLTAEGAALYLQQQESQLMVALQLKAQEEKLAAMQGG